MINVLRGVILNYAAYPMAIKIGNKNKKNVQIIVFEKILYIAEMRLIMKTSPFFMNKSGYLCYNKYGSLEPAGESSYLFGSHHQPPFC